MSADQTITKHASPEETPASTAHGDNVAGERHGPFNRKREQTWKIDLHPFVQELYSDLLLPEREDVDVFYDLLRSMIDDLGAHTRAEQYMMFRRAYQIQKDLRADRLTTTLVEREMKAAANAAFERLVDPDGRGGLVNAATARERAKKARFGLLEYDDGDLVEAGLGDYPIETEAAIRAMPNLMQLEKMRSANQREKINTLKELALYRQIMERSADGQPKANRRKST